MKSGNRVLKRAMLSTISIASLGMGSIAYAQDEAPQAEEAAVDDDVIIVTATKREQTLQEIPVAVTVTTAEDIEKAQVRDLADLQTLAPTLRVNQYVASAMVQTTPVSNHRLVCSLTEFIVRVLLHKLAIFPTCSVSKFYVVRNQLFLVKTHRQALSRSSLKLRSISSAALQS
jgi:hypothetical protein